MGQKISRRDFLFGFRKRMLELSFTNKKDLNVEELKKADGFLRSGDFSKAKDILEKVVEDYPEDLVARQKLAYAYYKIGDIKSAKNEFLVLRKKGVKSNFISLYLGLCFAHDGNLKTAINIFKEFFDITKPIIQRAINLQIALFDSDLATQEDMIKTIENAIKEQENL